MEEFLAKLENAPDAWGIIGREVYGRGGLIGTVTRVVAYMHNATMLVIDDQHPASVSEVSAQTEVSNYLIRSKILSDNTTVWNKVYKKTTVWDKELVTKGNPLLFAFRSNTVDPTFLQAKCSRLVILLAQVLNLD